MHSALGGFLGRFMNGFRLALRGLARRPGFALLAMLTLAAGIGPTTAVYAVFRQVLLRELPVPKPGELVLLEEHSGYETGSLDAYGGGSQYYFSPPAYRALRAAYPQLAAAAMHPVNFATAREALRSDAEMVSGNYFSVLGERPLLGRLLTDADDRVHAGNPVAVLSAAFWRSRFGASSAVLNMPITLNGAAFTVVGVAPGNGLMDGNKADVFVPKTMRPAISQGRLDTEFDPLSRWLLIMGRVPQAERAQVAARLASVWVNHRRETLRTHSDSISNKKEWMETHLSFALGSRGVSLLAQELGTPVQALQAMTLLVLLVACANLASFLLARAASRRGELAVRAALGAGRWEQSSVAIAEGLLVGVGGTILGCAQGWACLRLLGHALPTDSDTAMVAVAPWHWPVLLFAGAAGLLTSLLFSFGPALANARIRAVEVMHAGSSVLGGATRARGVMVAFTLALSLLLLLVALMFGWNLYEVSTANPGFSISHLLEFNVDESATGATPARTAQVYASILAGAREHGGVQSASYAEMALFNGSQHSSNITIEGRPDTTGDPEPMQNWVSTGFFQTLGVPLIRGRAFAQADGADSEHVALIDEAFVRKFFNGDTSRAMDSHFGFGEHTKMKFDVHIVGIVPSVHAYKVTQTSFNPYLYLPYSQSYDDSRGRGNSHPATFYIRTTGDPNALAADMRALVHRIDPKLPITYLETMQQQISDSIADTRLLALLSLALGALAALLAAVGLYGVLAYQVATRTREIGLRMALGASRTRIVGLLLGKMLRLTAWGMGAGAVLAWGAMRLLHAQMAELKQAPVWLYVAAALVLLAAALLAALVPSFRAARIDPMQALRTE